MPTRQKTTSAFRIFAFAAAAALPAAAQGLLTAGVSAVPTYEAVGLTWSSPGAGNAGCDVRYKRSSDASWSTGYPLWFDSAANQCRGSIVSLQPGTAYDVQMGVNGSWLATASFTTWANEKPIAQTVKVPSGSTTLDITAGGTASGYVLYDGSGSTLDAQNLAATNINVNASYVIVRGFTLKGAQQHGILIDRNQHDVIVEDNDISGWGRTRDGTWGTDMDSGIRAICSTETLTRVTIQRNRIHDPRYPANSWSDGHPAGPQGITFSYCGGNNVYRWNEIYSAQNHFNDGMGGEDNFSTTGWPNKDSDVYGNRIEMTWDDGLEIEGGNNNVRVWGNYLNNTATGIASTVTSVGPLYIFRNVYNRSRFFEKASADTDDRQPMFKSGSSVDFGNGRRYLFHNTMLQATQAGLQYSLGGGAGIGGTGSTQPVNNTVSMNNIYHLWKPNGAFYQIGSGNTFQNDMTNATSTPEVGGIVATPRYAAGHGWQSESNGLYQLAAGTPGYDQGARIQNFNDGFLGAAPDVGAAEGGAAAMKFGIAAASSTTSGTPAAPTTPPPPPPTTPPPPPPATTPSTPGSVTPSSGMDSSSYTITTGQSVTFTANVYGNNGTATGTMQFTSDNSVISGCTAVAMSAGKAACTTAALAAGSHAIRGVYSGDATYGTGTAGPITQTVNAAAAPPPPAAPTPPSTPASTLSNISTRAHVGTGNDVLIGGFVIQGASAKTVVVTATGPSLAGAGVTNAIGNPTLTLVRGDGTVVATNDDWGTAPNATQIQSAGFAPAHPRESAIMATLAPGAYTAIVADASGGTGVGMVAAYEVDHPDTPLVNVSTRAMVSTGNDVLIGGFVIQGSSPQSVIVRASGPSMASAGITNALANPVLTLVRADGTAVATNDDWGLAPNAADIRASGFAPLNPAEPAILVSLPPGAYTAIVTGAGGTRGIGTVEVFKTP